MGKRYLWDEVPWLTMLPHQGRPRVVACSQFGWLMSMALHPADMSTAPPEQRLRNAARFAVALQTLGGGRWIWVEERRVPLLGIATPTPDNRAAHLFGVDRAAVHGEGAHYGSRHYVSVRHNPPSGLAVRLRNAMLLPEPGETRGENSQKAEAITPVSERRAVG
jgi:type IV secretion system protein TrbE